MKNFDDEMMKEKIDTALPQVKTLLSIFFPSSQIHFNSQVDKQKVGIDVLIDKSISIDLKFRTVVYNDILLEYEHNYYTGERAKGWVNDPTKKNDFIAYIFKPNWFCFLLPMQKLRQAWLNYGKDWLERYPTGETENEGHGNGWTTSWCLVPIDIIIFTIPETRIADLNGIHELK